MSLPPACRLPALAALPRGAAAVSKPLRLTTPSQFAPLTLRSPLPGVTDVYVSAVVDHLVAVNDADYRFEVGGFHFSLDECLSSASRCFGRQHLASSTW